MLQYGVPGPESSVLVDDISRNVKHTFFPLAGLGGPRSLRTHRLIILEAA